MSTNLPYGRVMALTSNDETDLLLPLYGGLQEVPRFATFLDRLKRRTGADHVALTVKRDEASARLRPYRVYGRADLAGHEPTERVPPGMADERLVRIPVAPGLSGWLTLARTRACSAADGALLSNLAPYIETALRTQQVLERGRADNALSSDGLVRAGSGWMLLDADARVLAIEPATAARLAAITGTEPRIGERLRKIPAAAERELTHVAQNLARDAGSGSGAAVLWEEPRVDVLLLPADRNMADQPYPAAVMTAWCRFDTGPGADSADHFARLYDLPRREAQLAMALAWGKSIAQAAEAMGLTIETARNYSKRLYAKLGVSGQADLVRLVHRSGAVLA